MATYLEIREASEDPTLLVKVMVACLVAADTISGEATSVDLHPERLLWAKSVYNDPNLAARRMMGAVLAKNKALTKAQILAASDAGVQTAVDAAVNVFANVG